MATPKSEGSYPGSDRDAGGQYSGTGGLPDNAGFGNWQHQNSDPVHSLYTPKDQQSVGWGETEPSMQLSEGERIGLQGVNEIPYDPMGLVSSEKIMIDPAPANRGKEN